MITGTVRRYGRNKAGIKDNKLACSRVYLDMDNLDSQYDMCTEKIKKEKFGALEICEGKINELCQFSRLLSNRSLAGVWGANSSLAVSQ